MSHVVFDLLTSCDHKISGSREKLSRGITIVVTVEQIRKSWRNALKLFKKNKQKLVFAKCVFACLLFAVKVLVSIFQGCFLLFGFVGLRDIIFKC